MERDEVLRIVPRLDAEHAEEREAGDEERRAEDGDERVPVDPREPAHRPTHGRHAREPRHQHGEGEDDQRVVGGEHPAEHEPDEQQLHHHSRRRDDDAAREPEPEREREPDGDGEEHGGEAELKERDRLVEAHAASAGSVRASAAKSARSSV